MLGAFSSHTHCTEYTPLSCKASGALSCCLGLRLQAKFRIKHCDFHSCSVEECGVQDVLNLLTGSVTSSSFTLSKISESDSMNVVQGQDVQSPILGGPPQCEEIHVSSETKQI